MIANSEKIKLIFGLKVRQLRQEKGINLSTLAERSGVSVSYLNEIESGKKYPKSDKILALAKALEADYDTLVSMKLSKKLQPVAELLNSPILQELPLELFGIQPTDLLEILAQAPARFSAFINTIIEISRSYGMRVEQFFVSALRSFQEIHDNYFPEIEEAAESFLKEAGVQTVSADLLKNVLEQRFGYVIEAFDEASHPDLANLRSVFLPNQHKLLVHRGLTSEQRAFTFGREVGYQVMKLEQRPLVSSVLEVESFEEMLNNFRGSYFSGALLMPQQMLADALNDFFRQPNWDSGRFLDLISRFQATPEMFLRRITSVLTSRFGINQLFFIRFDNVAGENFFALSKELHLAKLHNPHATLREHYCRRWVSLTILQELADLQTNNTWDGQPLCRAQISEYENSDNRYLVISLAKPSPPKANMNSSVSIGFAIDNNLKGLVRFLDDPALLRRTVAETCERCGVLDCQERSASPLILQKQVRIKQVSEAVKRLNR